MEAEASSFRRPRGYAEGCALSPACCPQCSQHISRERGIGTPPLRLLGTPSQDSVMPLASADKGLLMCWIAFLCDLGQLPTWP